MILSGPRALILDRFSLVYGYMVYVHMVYPPECFIRIFKKQKVRLQHLPAEPALLLPFLLMQCFSHLPWVCSSP